MTRKVCVEGEATVLVPIKVKFSMTIRADDDASIEKCIKQHAKAKRYTKADVEDVEIVEILDINGYDSTDDLEAGIQETMEGCGTYTVDLDKCNVTDSR